MKRNTPDRLNTLIYARVSSKEQDREGFSIPAQLKLLRTYAESKNLTVLREFVDVETAKQAGRTGFGEMLAFLRKSESCRTILVEKTDRLYRNLKDWVTLDELPLEIHFVKENVVISSESRSSEKFMHGIKVLMAKNYIDNLSEETRKGMLEKASQGIYPSYAPMGYVNVQCNGKRYIQPDPRLGPLIQKLYEWYSTGNYSLLEVTKKVQSEGLVYRKSGEKIHKSIVYKILTNPIYYGEFDWDGKRYRGIHERIIGKEVFDRVQEVLREKGRRRTRQQKHHWAFQGLVSCGCCGCALTAELKKGKYVYYHCTGHKGRCGERYVREEELARQFGEALRAIRVDHEVQSRMVTALKASHSDERQYHNEMISSLQAQNQKLQNRIDGMYLDKLDGKITSAFYDLKSEEWRAEQAEISRKMEKHRNANCSYMDEGVRLLELAQKAASLYEKQEMGERRRLLNFVFSNSTWKSGRLTPNYRQPFDMLAVANMAHQKQKATEVASNINSEDWLLR